MNENNLWASLSKRSEFVEQSIDQLRRKRTGSYYTDLILTDVMMQDLVNELIKSGKSLINCKFLEPCVGVGNFVFSYIKAVKNLGISNEQASILLDNIFVCDINQEALDSYKESLGKLALEYFNINLSDEYFKEHIGRGLLFDVTKETFEYTPLEDVFKFKSGDSKFDIVVTNPPYKNLKAEKSHYSDSLEYEIDKEKYLSIKNFVKKNYYYASDGNLNLYKIFMEEILEKYSKNDAFISLLVPSTILSDKTSSKLRTRILNNSKLVSVKVIKEGSNFIDAQQSLAAVLIQKGSKSDIITLFSNFVDYPESYEKVDIVDILNDSTGNAIFAVSREEYKILKKLRKFPTIKELDYIVNYRGELDLTLNKSAIIEDESKFQLLRGRNLSKYFLLEDNGLDYVDELFVNQSAKRQYVLDNRIACQQISNMNNDIRVKFSFVPRNYVLGNSCNFISILDNDNKIDIFAILGILNSKLINWFFKLTSSNNHVNNYEIDTFPIPINALELEKISELVQEYLITKDNKLAEKVEELVNQAYKLDNGDLLDEYINSIKKIIHTIEKNQAIELLNNNSLIGTIKHEMNDFELKTLTGLIDKFSLLSKGYILNHHLSKLSELDLEMIKSVPPGGNWKNIPEETVNKSKRLKRITETGGRTTLYGRLDYDKPSYTITTYFNRPGNGTYVHPVHERVITAREAARFQTFPDDYYFYGNKSQLLKQIGNAVPTLLAYQIGKTILDKTGCNKSVDLFCGAGGITYGFKQAGINSVVSNDIEVSACVTLKINNPEINVICGDLTQNITKEKIISIALEQKAEIICGGPPCQGFSMAGFRADNDPRNQLFRDFVDIVEHVRPKIIVFENVEGLLSYKGGDTYREVLKLFSELGYNTEGRTLVATEYGVPQKRKRVIIICTREDLEVSPSDLFPKKLITDPVNQINVRETIFDLEDVSCGEDAKYLSQYESLLINLLKSEISYEEYIEEILKDKTVLEDRKLNRQMNLFDFLDK